jgi:hypothetical protein
VHCARSVLAASSPDDIIECAHVHCSSQRKG